MQRTIRILRRVVCVVAIYQVSLTLFSQNIGINNTGVDPNASAALDIEFTNKGLLIPRMTTAQRDAISNPANSLLIYNTTTECFEAYHVTSASWISMSCLGCQLPGSFSATAATNVTSTEVDVNWSASSGATTYYLDVDDNSDFSSPVSGYNNLNVGNVNTYNVTGLVCNTTYYYRLRAGNDCGASSNSNTITFTTGGCFTGCINTSSTVVVDVVNTYTGKTWMDRNLGASQAATSSTDALAYGCLYQWGRAAEGHENRGGGNYTAALATTAVPNLGNPWDGLFVTASGLPSDWLTPQDNTLWQGVSGTNNPCPAGYRLPTNTEYSAERASWVQPPISSTDDANGAYASPLKFTLAGYRALSSGVVTSTGAMGTYSSSSFSGIYDGHLIFYPASASVNNGGRAHGRSVRCIKN